MTDTQKDFEALTWAISRLEHLALARAHGATDRNDAKRFAACATASIGALRAALSAQPAVDKAEFVQIGWTNESQIGFASSGEAFFWGDPKSDEVPVFRRLAAALKGKDND